MIRRALAGALGLGILLTPAAFAFDHTEYGGDLYLEVVLKRVFGGGDPYDYKAAPVRNKTETEKDGETRSVDLTVDETSFSLDGADPSGESGPLDGSLKTRNGKVYKILQPEEGPARDGFYQWVADFVGGNSANAIDVSVATIKGKIKGGAGDDPLTTKILIKYKGTVSSGINFGDKLKGKIKLGGTVDPILIQ